MACKFCGPKLSLCGLVLSVWGIIQLTLMGVFYYIRAVALLEDLPLDEHHHSMDSFITNVETGYTQFFMGIFYYFEVVTLLEDVEAEEYDDYDDFIHKTQHNYRAVAQNCWIASVIYIVFIVISYGCIVKAKKSMRLEALKLQDDEYICTPKPPPKTKPSKVK
ncbi:hypothetical protein HF086_011727 [Spodoptera exigua]|uniref:Uncharacterized protein n=1 Tax=Spodoptera exigua TaxID=7107 RepID=A0A922MXL6_SPOEX|nr:hypothetical protein HF086_011727 [Spodoptera exigua]